MTTKTKQGGNKKMKKWKRALGVSLAAVMTLGLVACGSSSEESQETEAQEMETEESGEVSLEGKKITFMTCQGKFFEEYNTMAEAIEKDYGCDVEFQVVPDSEYSTLLKVKLSTSEVPDVFEYNFPTQNIELGASEYCEDLSNEEWVSRLVNPDLVKDANDGKIYALPKESSSGYMAVYYNKEVLKNCGIEDPHPKTYDEFLDILETVKQKGNGVTPLLVTNKDNWTTQIFMTCGFPVILGDKAEDTFQKLLKNEIKWTDVPEFQEVLQDYVDLIDAGYVNEDYLSAGYDMAAERIGEGQAAMYVINDAWAVDMASKYPDCELGTFVIPYGDNDVMATGAFVQGLFVPKSGAQTDVAKEFLKVWSDPKYQNLYYDSIPGSPAFNDVDGGEILPCIANLVDNYITPGNYTYQINDQMAECSTIWTELWNFYIEASTGDKTPEEVFDNFQLIYEDFMMQQGAEGF